MKLTKNECKKVIVIFLGSCFEQNTDFLGNDVGNWTATSDKNDCQKECQNYGSCNYWTYNTIDGKCHMKSSDSGRKSLNGAISGPKLGSGKLSFY